VTLRIPGSHCKTCLNSTGNRADKPSAMAEQAPTASANAGGEGGKSRGKKTIITIGLLLALEAVVIIGAMKMLGSGPTEVSAEEVAHQVQLSEEDKIVELLVLNAQFANNKSGVTYLYPAEVYVQVKKRHADKVKAEIEQFQNEIKAEVTAIWRTAEPQHFQEPKLENLTRKVYALVNDRFGLDKEKSEPVVSKVVIVMSTGFRIDS
jgi:flagellar basal body-associated protein FliL